MKKTYKSAQLDLKTHERLTNFSKMKRLKITATIALLAEALETGEVEIKGTKIKVS